MNRRTSRVFCLFITALFISSCSSLDFISSGNTPFKISAGKKSEQIVEISSTADFYFWGHSPENLIVDLEDSAHKMGLEDPSAVTISQMTNWKSIFFSLVTLGLYCPVEYKISLLAKREEAK